MSAKLTFIARNTFVFCLIIILSVFPAIGQVSDGSTKPLNRTGNGKIDEINSKTSATIKVTNNNSYSTNFQSIANDPGYNSLTGHYYFKKNLTSISSELIKIPIKDGSIDIYSRSS